MAYYSEVKFLNDCNPALIERNSQEFQRIRNLLESVVPSVTRAKDGTQWESVSRESYDARIKDVHTLVEGLFNGFNHARLALHDYAVAVEKAKHHLEDGKHAQERLKDLVASVATAVTRSAQKAEPMKRWEDIRSTTGILDAIAEFGMDADSIREPANRAYQQAGDAFEQAKTIETNARELCLAKLKAAQQAVPDFRGGTFKDAKAMLNSIGELTAEATQAAAMSAHVHLPGTSPNGDVLAGAGKKDISPALARIRELLEALPPGKGSWDYDQRTGGKADWITNNRELILAAAKETGLPPDVIAAIAYEEVGGKPYSFDDIAEKVRTAAESKWSPVIPENLPPPFTGDRDNTSYGPMAVQIRRAAEVLGYDPAHLSNDQRDEIRSALKDPAQNLFIAAKYMENLKAESNFAHVPAEQMTQEHYRELAKRYNGGPDWEGDKAEDYSERVEKTQDEAKRALG